MHALTLPRLGQTMTQGTILEWCVQERQPYKEGDLLYVIETDKTSLEIESTRPGSIVRIIADVGSELSVGTLLAIVSDPGEDPDEAEVEAFLLNSLDSDSAAGFPAEAGQEAETAASRPGSQNGEPEPERRDLQVMPRARRLAKELGISLSTIEGTGHGGSITEKDVRRAAEKLAPAAAQKSGEAGSGLKIRDRHRLGGIQNAMARQMVRSWQVPQFSQAIEIDTRPLQERRGQLGVENRKLTYTDLLIDALITALGSVPECNATFDGEELITYETINVGVAVGIEKGLVVPVLRNCNEQDLVERSDNLAKLVSRARGGLLGPDEFADATITLSNLGMTRVEFGVPLVNAPQVCLVFAGTVVEKPVVQSGTIVIAPMMHLVCAYDHRIIDGATGAKFITALRDALISS